MVSFGNTFFLFIYPVLWAVIPSVRRFIPNFIYRLLLAVIPSWVALNAIRWFALPGLIASAEASGNMGYDGVGGNVVILLFGGVIPFFIFCIIEAIIAIVIKVKLEASKKAL